MRPIPNTIDRNGDLFATNTAAYRADLATLSERLQFAIDGGDHPKAASRQRSIDRHHGRGKVMARDRIDMIIDEGSPFLEPVSYTHLTLPTKRIV